MTDPDLTRTSETRIRARVIAADPVTTRPERIRRTLATHPGGRPVLWAAGLVTGLDLAPLLLDRLQLDPARWAATAAHTAATPWPGGSTPLLWPATFAYAAGIVGLVVLLLGLVGAKVDDLVLLVLSVALTALTARGAWSTIDVVNRQAWWALPACVALVAAFVLAARAAVAWKTTGTRFTSGGTVGAALRAWAVLLVLLVAGSAIATNVELSGAGQPVSASATTPDLEGVRSADAAAVTLLRGHWVAQLASTQVQDDSQATSYLQQHQELATRYGAVLARGDDVSSGRLDSSFWLTLANLGMGSESEVLNWCAAAGLGIDDCMPRDLSSL